MLNPMDKTNLKRRIAKATGLPAQDVAEALEIVLSEILDHIFQTPNASMRIGDFGTFRNIPGYSTGALDTRTGKRTSDPEPIAKLSFRPAAGLAGFEVTFSPSCGTFYVLSHKFES